MKKFLSILSLILAISIFLIISAVASDELKIGITNFEPMNYWDENGNLTGFDTELAQYVCQKLGLTPEFIEIEWDAKTAELNSGNIDCVWNGMVLTEERKSDMDCSDVYAVSPIYVIKNKGNPIEYTTLEDMNQHTFAVEAGSQSQMIAENYKLNFNVVASEINALKAVESGDADLCLVSSLTAGKSLKDDFYVLEIAEAINSEEFVIGFKKGSQYTSLVNAALKSAREDGTLKSLADKYGICVDSVADFSPVDDKVQEQNSAVEYDEAYVAEIARKHRLSEKSVNFMIEHNVDFSLFENAEVYPEDHPIKYNDTIESLILQAQAYGFTDEQINAYINGSLNSKTTIHGGKYDNTGAKRVTVPVHPLTINGYTIDYETSEYPIISYNGIMYFPMTWHYSRLLGLNTEWSAESGLSIERCETDATELPEYEKRTNTDEYIYAPVADYNITINGKKYDNSSEEYPVLCFRKITYFPLTGNLIADEFGFNYSFDNINGLVID